MDDERKVAVEERQSVRGGQGPSDTVLSEPIELGQIQELSLSFKNIVRIDNLVGLHSLTTLRLDNNIISRVENLAHLAPTLTFLDLSFNNIDSVDGAPARGGEWAAPPCLTPGTRTGGPGQPHRPLPIQQQRQQRAGQARGSAQAAGLGASAPAEPRRRRGGPHRARERRWPQSVGNNSLTSVEELKCLRKLSSLRALSVEGNPLSDEKGEHKTWIYAFLPQLHYLDWVLIQDEDKRQAREHLQDELQGTPLPIAGESVHHYVGSNTPRAHARVRPGAQRRRTRRRDCAGTRNGGRVRRHASSRPHTRTHTLFRPA